MRLDASDTRFLRADFGGADAYKLRTDDLLFTRYNGNRDFVGVCARVPELDSETVYPDKLIRVRIRHDLADPRYVERAVHTAEARQFIAEKLKTSAGQVGISGADLKNLTIPLAPLPEQKRIADKLDTLLARVDTCRNHLTRVPAILKRFRQSVLAAATSGELTREWRAHVDDGTTAVPPNAKPRDDESATEISLPSTWVMTTGADIVEPGADIVYGIVQPGQRLAEGIPYVRGMDIERGQILVSQLLKTSPAIASRYARSALKGGDVLLGIIRATKVAIVPECLAGANITQGTAHSRPSAMIQTRYLAVALESPAIQSWLHAHYRGIDMPGLNLADVRQVPISLPPIEEQTEIVRRVESLFAIADQLEARYTTARTHIDRLTPALLAKAFCGELVRQDPGDTCANPPRSEGRVEPLSRKARSEPNHR